MPTDNPEKLFMRFNMSKPQDYSGRSMGISDVLSICSDGEITSYYVDEGEYTELISFIGVERQNTKRGMGSDVFENVSAVQVVETAAQLAQLQEPSAQLPPLQPETAQEQPTTLPELPPPDDSANEGDSLLENLMSNIKEFADVDVYPHSLQEATAHGYIEVYKFDLMINQQCTEDIDDAIKGSKVEGAEGEYRLMDAVNKVIGKYGRNRIAWVLSVAIKNAKGTHFSEDNKAWSDETLTNIGFPNEPPTFFINSNPVLLNVFVSRFREAQKQKLGYTARIKKAEKRVNSQSQQKP